jgi:hypothetical protein
MIATHTIDRPHNCSSPLERVSIRTRIWLESSLVPRRCTKRPPPAAPAEPTAVNEAVFTTRERRLSGDYADHLLSVGA